jgi:hypothetical protein
MHQRKNLAVRWHDLVAMEQTAEPVLGRASLLDQLASMGNQRPQLAHRGRWDPDSRHRIGDQEFGQPERIASIGFNGERHFRLGLRGIGNHHTSNQWLEQVVNVPGIGRRFQHDLIGWTEMALCPAFKLRKEDPTRCEHNLLLGVECSNHDVVLMEV